MAIFNGNLKGISRGHDGSPADVTNCWNFVDPTARPQRPVETVPVLPASSSLRGLAWHGMAG